MAELFLFAFIWLYIGYFFASLFESPTLRPYDFHSFAIGWPSGLVMAGYEGFLILVGYPEGIFWPFMDKMKELEKEARKRHEKN